MPHITAEMAGKNFFALAALALVASATQINVYHDGACQEYAYTVYSNNWECVDINGVESVIKVNSPYQCNVYYRTGCKSFAFTLDSAQCANAPLGGSFGSVACAH
jgi:hypothetical protein